MFLSGKSKSKNPDALRSGTVERVTSRMFAVSPDPAAFENHEIFWKRLHDTDELTFGQTAKPPFTVTYKGIQYEFDTAAVEFDSFEDDPSLSWLNDREKEAVMDSDHAYGVEMIFADNNMDSFHLQVKLLYMLVPDMVALMDLNGYRAYSSRQFYPFYMIRMFRDMGLDLSEIKEYMQGRTPEKFARLLAEQDQALIKMANVLHKDRFDGNTQLNWNYSDFENVGKKQFPTRMHVTLTSPKKEVSLGIKLNYIGHESDWESRTVIPGKYKKVTVDEILRRFMAL